MQTGMRLRSGSDGRGRGRHSPRRLLAIRASELAFLVGEGSYYQQHEILFQTLARNHWLPHEFVSNVGTSYSSFQPTTSTVTTAAAIATTSSPDTTTTITTTAKMKGKETEQAVVEAYQMTSNNIRRYHKLICFPERPEWEIVVIGKIDGRLPDTKQLVEIKRRTYRFPNFHSPPVYDLIQCHAYLFICDESQILLKEIDDTGREYDTWIYRNPERWTQWMSRLQSLLIAVEKLFQPEHTHWFELYQYSVIMQNWKLCHRIIHVWILQS